MQALYSNHLCASASSGLRNTEEYKDAADTREILKSAATSQVARARSNLGPSKENMRRTFAVVAAEDTHWRHSMAVEAAGTVQDPRAQALPHSVPAVHADSSTVIEVHAGRRRADAATCASRPRGRLPCCQQ